MTTRQEKIRELLKEEVADILRKEMKDPRLGFITVTDAEITADLRHAKVFVSIMGSDEVRAENMKLLKNAGHFIRQSVGKRIRMKTLPEIEFKLDTSVDQAIHMLELLEQIKHDEEHHSPDRGVDQAD